MSPLRSYGSTAGSISPGPGFPGPLFFQEVIFGAMSYRGTDRLGAAPAEEYSRFACRIHRGIQRPVSAAAGRVGFFCGEGQN